MTTKATEEQLRREPNDKGASTMDEIAETIKRGVCPSCTWRMDIELVDGICPQCGIDWNLPDDRNGWPSRAYGAMHRGRIMPVARRTGMWRDAGVARRYARE